MLIKNSLQAATDLTAENSFQKVYIVPLSSNIFTELDFIVVTTTETRNLIPSFYISPQSTLKESSFYNTD